MKDLKVNSSTGINLPIGNLISIIGACLVAAWFGFSIIEILPSVLCLILIIGCTIFIGHCTIVCGYFIVPLSKYVN